MKTAETAPDTELTSLTALEELLWDHRVVVNRESRRSQQDGTRMQIFSPDLWAIVAALKNQGSSSEKLANHLKLALQSGLPKEQPLGVLCLLKASNPITAVSIVFDDGQHHLAASLSGELAHQGPETRSFRSTGSETTRVVQNILLALIPQWDTGQADWTAIHSLYSQNLAHYNLDGTIKT